MNTDLSYAILGKS